MEFLFIIIKPVDYSLSISLFFMSSPPSFVYHDYDSFSDSFFDYEFTSDSSLSSGFSLGFTAFLLDLNVPEGDEYLVKAFSLVPIDSNILSLRPLLAVLPSVAEGTVGSPDVRMVRLGSFYANCCSLASPSNLHFSLIAPCSLLSSRSFSSLWHFSLTSLYSLFPTLTRDSLTHSGRFSCLEYFFHQLFLPRSIQLFTFPLSFFSLIPIVSAPPTGFNQLINNLQSILSSLSFPSALIRHSLFASSNDFILLPLPSSFDLLSSSTLFRVVRLFSACSLLTLHKNHSHSSRYFVHFLPSYGEIHLHLLIEWSGSAVSYRNSTVFSFVKTLEQRILEAKQKLEYGILSFNQVLNNQKENYSMEFSDEEIVINLPPSLSVDPLASSLATLYAADSLSLSHSTSDSASSSAFSSLSEILKQRWNSARSSPFVSSQYSLSSASSMKSIVNIQQTIKDQKTIQTLSVASH
jgi:hypothetical protein